MQDVFIHTVESLLQIGERYNYLVLSHLHGMLNNLIKTYAPT